MMCTGKKLHQFHPRGEAVKKFALCLETDHPILACAEHQSRRMDRAGICKQPIRRLVEIDKNIDRDLAEDQRVGIVTSSLLFVVREHLRLDVTLHVTRAEQFLFQPQNWNREWNVEFHVKSRRG